MSLWLSTSEDSQSVCRSAGSRQGLKFVCVFMMAAAGSDVVGDETKTPESSPPTAAVTKATDSSNERTLQEKTSPEKTSQVIPSTPINDTPRVGPGKFVEGGGVRFIFYPRGKNRHAYQFDPDEKLETDRSNPSAKEREEVFRHYSDIMLKGVSRFRERKYEEAFEKFRMATEVIKRDPTSRIYAAHALLAMGDYKAAVSFIREALILEPEVLGIDWNLPASYGPSVNAQKDYHKHLNRLKRRMATTPPNTDLKILLAYVYLCSQKPAEALKLVERAKRQTKDDSLLLGLEKRSRTATLGGDVAVTEDAGQVAKRP